MQKTSSVDQFKYFPILNFKNNCSFEFELIRQYNANDYYFKLSFEIYWDHCIESTIHIVSKINFTN